MTTISRQPVTPPEVKIILAIAAIFVILVILMMTSCGKPDEVKPVYFRIDRDIRDRQTRDPETKETYWIRDTCWILHPFIAGRYTVNNIGITQTQCRNESGAYWNLCDVHPGDVIGIDVAEYYENGFQMPYDGVIDYEEIIE